MPNNDMYKKGLKIRTEVLGSEYVDKAINSLSKSSNLLLVIGLSSLP